MVRGTGRCAQYIDELSDEDLEVVERHDRWLAARHTLDEAMEAGSDRPGDGPLGGRVNDLEVARSAGQKAESAK